MGAVVPFDLQRAPTFQHRPCVVANHRDAAERLEAVGRLECIERDRLLRAGRWAEGRFDLLGLGLTGRYNLTFRKY